MTKQSAIWVTGASSGIGQSLVKKFTKEKFTVIGTARRTDKLKKIAQQLPSDRKFDFYQNDVSKSDDVSAVANKINEHYNVNCLVNNAGVTSFKTFSDNTLEEIENIIDTNLKGSIYTIKSILPQMIENKSGTIINILSVAAVKIFTNSSIYAASKAGLEAFSKVIREELREFNIRIINIYPGATSTEIWSENAIDKFANKMMTPENLAEFIYNIYSTSNLLSPEEIVVRPISGDL